MNLRLVCMSLTPGVTFHQRRDARLPSARRVCGRRAARPPPILTILRTGACIIHPAGVVIPASLLVASPSGRESNPGIENQV